jgi:ABC-type dipeptide/oligopeptide/nickel transport system ATPase component
MHAACVVYRTNTVIIVAKSGKGKSYIADCICNSNSECSVVGDDHVIISKNHIQGNKKRRMRNIHGESVAYLNNIGIAKLQNSIYICFELSSDKNEMKYLSESEAIQYFSEAAAFKYLNEIFVHNGRSYGPNIFVDLNEEYKSIFCNFIEKDKVLFIRGSFPFAVDIISKLMK